MEDMSKLRNKMVDDQIAARGVRDPAVLRAMREVPREKFILAELIDFAYSDTPLPIQEGQTISQPFIVAVMAEAMEISPEDRVLEVGTGSGYAAAVLSRIAGSVYTIERREDLARTARDRLDKLGYGNISVLRGDGSLGWPLHAPYDAIVVAAGGPEVPRPLLDQLAVGGRLVMPVGSEPRSQGLVRVRKVSETQFDREDLGAVSFVPLIGAAAWEEEKAERPAPTPPSVVREHPVGPVREAAEEFASIEEANMDGLMDRIGDARVVLLGEASHGTSEFYRMRARITRELIEKHGFNIVAVEADWPDAAQVDSFVRGTPVERPPESAFGRFPTWMWANREVLEFVQWLKSYNDAIGPQEGRDRQPVAFHGLDLYSLNASIDAVLKYLDDFDPETARVARQRYGCLSPWERDPARYGAAALSGRYRECEPEVVKMLRDLLSKQLEYGARGRDGSRFFDAVQNARLIKDAERYYRIMYYGSSESWNLRDRHMFETLETVLGFHGPRARAVVWEHNSHIGDASATEMGKRGEQNVGQFCRERFGGKAYLVGFGTDHGTVAAASDWGGPMEVKHVRPAHPDSYERLCHESEVGAFLLPLRGDGLGRPELRHSLLKPRLERAIGVVYRPETELQSHYFQASLPRQFDEYIWFDETRAVMPLTAEGESALPDRFPFGV